jgi:selenocysteine-specific elongation factor
MHVIGTAGHVDHGKSTLVEALTGIHPDRLKEEREREMTIDLGFAWLTLPDGEDVGIVDVPGHRDFIENMLAGVGGIDAALFVVAADEGVMPQTREHLAILDLLQVQGGVVALTKVDLMPDRDWLALVEDDLRQALAGTVLADVPLVRVSARTREGLPELIQALQACLAGRPHRPDYGRPRLPVDRVFTIAGFGTVVTGTLSDGMLRLGDDVEILPGGLRARVRGLQTHKRKEEIAVPGSRTAVNLAGVDVDQVQRGQVVARLGSYRSTRRLDVRFRLLPDIAQPLKHNMALKLFLGAAEVVARLRLLGAEELCPGESGWLQLELEEEVVAVRGDRYILRRPSPGETLGGGTVVDPFPRGRHKRFSADTLLALAALQRGTPAEVVMQALMALGAAPLKDVLERANLESGPAGEALTELRTNGQLVDLEARGENLPPDAWVTSLGFWDELSLRAVQEVEGYHQVFPLRRGLPREELKSRLKLPARLFNSALRRWAAAQSLCEAPRQDGTPLVYLPGHAIRYNPEQQRSVQRLLGRFSASPYTPPSVKESQAEVGDEVYAALLENGDLLQVAPEVAFSRAGYAGMVSEIRQLLVKQGTLTAAQVRDHFNTSRKYALALLEYLDARGITVREGDARRLK